MRKIENIFSVLTGISLAVVFIVTFGQVIQRYVFQLPMPWATDVIRIFFVYSIFLGMGVGVFKKAHLNIDVLVQVFPSWAKPHELYLYDHSYCRFLYGSVPPFRYSKTACLSFRKRQIY